MSDTIAREATAWRGKPLSELLPTLQAAGYIIPQNLSYRTVWERAASGRLDVTRQGARLYFDEDRKPELAAALGLELAASAAA